MRGHVLLSLGRGHSSSRAQRGDKASGEEHSKGTQKAVAVAGHGRWTKKQAMAAEGDKRRN